MGDVAWLDLDAAMIERAAQRFRRDIWNSVTADAVSESGVEVRRFGPVLATAFADLPESDSLNQIQGAAEPSAIEGGHLAEAVEWMRSREVDYRVPVADERPGTAVAERWLGARGYVRGGGWLKLVRDAAPPEWREQSHVTVYELGEEEADGEGLSEILAEALELPLTAGSLFFSLPQTSNWRCYTAAVRPEPKIVAAASMMVCEGVAQLGPDGTLAAGRNRGCHTALLRRRLEDAAALGCHTVFAELGAAGPGPAAMRRNLMRAGFHLAYASRDWQRPALHPAASLHHH